MASKKKKHQLAPAKKSGAKKNAARNLPAPQKQESSSAALEENPIPVAAEPPLPIVGMCASAGGLDAFKKFFAAMPPRSGIAFVLIPHLDPHHESLMVELLSRHTTMPVVEAAEGMRVEPNHVYVIPPNKYMTISTGVLGLTGPVERRDTSFDGFLRSLADDQQEKAICVIFSGTGSHGVLGLKAVKANGGMVMVQDPKSAEYDRMPLSAVATGLADFVLPPADMPAALVNYAHHFYGNNHAETAAAELPDHLHRILALLRARTKHDFQCYRQKMLVRRIERRMGLSQIDSLSAYLNFLRNSRDEVKQLTQDLLISVTSFFRDPEAYYALQTQVIAPLVHSKDADDAIRVWVPGCATGEEPYSIGMLILEQLEAAKKHCDLQIFATDVDERALEVGRQGSYPETIATEVAPERLSRFFATANEHFYQVNKQLREVVVFAVQNMISDAPFSKLDLICCRNLLIYLEPEVQKKFIALLHFALNDGGYLFLGPSETIGRHTDLFEPVNKKWRIFRRIGPSRPERVDFPIASREGHRIENKRLAVPLPGRAVSFSELAQRQLLDNYAPAAVLINRNWEILHYSGPTTRFLEQPTGEPTQDLMALVREGLRPKLRVAVNRALRDNQAVSERGGRLKRNGSYAEVTITVRPMGGSRVPDGLLLVAFEEETPETPFPPSPTPEADEQSLVGQLEYELKASREDLQSTIEELESSNEELKAANEEGMSMNEELQSANEELETSKEELQSLNEELTTVNNQLQDKVQELETSNNDILNLLNCTDTGSVFLDANLRITRYTPAATQMFNLIAADVGRPLRDIAQKIADPELHADVEQVLRTLTPREKEVSSDGGDWWSRRIIPYRTASRRIEGVVITFANITPAKRSEQELRESQQLFRTAVEAHPNGMVMVDGQGHIVMVNAQTEKLFGYARDALIGQPVEVLVPVRFRTDHREFRSKFLDHPETRPMGMGRDLFGRRKDGSEFPVEIGLNPVQHKDAICVLGSITDITQRKQSEEQLRKLNESLEARVAERTHALRDSEEKNRAILDTAAEGIVTMSEEGILLSFNKAAERMFGYAAKEIIGQSVGQLIPSLNRQEQAIDPGTLISTGIRKVIGAGREVMGRREDGTTFPLELAVSELRDGGSHIFTGILRDIGQRRQMEREILEIAAREQRRIGQDLHDSVGQQLTGLSLLAEDLAESIADKLGEREKGRALKISKGLRDTLKEVRALSRGLTPVEVNPDSLMTALEELAQRVADLSRVECVFHCDRPVFLKDQQTATHLFRIAQEAIANALTHGHAGHVVIRLAAADKRTMLAIQDDGVGMPQVPPNAPGIGLKIMQYRAGLINAVLDIVPAKPRGTAVICTLRNGNDNDQENNTGAPTQD